MTGEVIKFGMEQYKTGARYQEKTNEGFAKREFNKFANEITFADLLKSLGNVTADERKMYETMFNHIAGGDKKINADELKGYFKDLQKAARTDGMLSHSEMEYFAQERGEFPKDETVALIFTKVSCDSLGKIPKFIKALINTNNNKLAEEEEQRDLEARTSYDADGNKTIVAKDGVASKTYSPDDKLIKDVFMRDGYKYIYEYKDGKLFKKTQEDEENKWVTTYNENENPIKVETIDKKNNYRATKTISYNSEGQKVKTVERSNYGATTEYYQNDMLTKSVEQYGDVVNEYYYAPSSKYQPARMVCKDKNGKVQYSEYYTYDANGNKIKTVEKDAEGKLVRTITGTYTQDGYLTREEEKNADGKTVCVTNYKKNGYSTRMTSEIRYNNDGTKETITYGNRGPSKKVTSDAAGNTIKSIEYTYNAQGKTAKEVYKDAAGNVTETVDYTYLRNETKEEHKDAHGQIMQVSYTKYQADGTTVFRDEFMQNNLLVCTHVWDTKDWNSTYTNGHGNPISREEFENLKN